MWDDSPLEPRWLDGARCLAPAMPDIAAGMLVQVELDVWKKAKASGRVGSITDVPREAAARLGIDISDDVAAEVLDRHRRHMAKLSRCRPEVRPTLLALRERGLKTGLLSMSHWPKEWHDELLRDDEIDDLFDICCYGSTQLRVKPHPDSFLAILGELNTTPEQAVFVGDHPVSDIAGAQAVGMRAIWFPNGTLDAIGAEPDAVVTQLADVVTVVDSWLRYASAGVSASERLAARGGRQ